VITQTKSALSSYRTEPVLNSNRFLSSSSGTIIPLPDNLPNNLGERINAIGAFHEVSRFLRRKYEV
jgi:hypothetical protein